MAEPRWLIAAASQARRRAAGRECLMALNALASLLRKRNAPDRGKDAWRGKKARIGEGCASCAFAATLPLSNETSASTFYHPDYTVGPGVSPDRGDCRRLRLSHSPGASLRVPQLISATGHPSRALPPIGNWESSAIEDSLTLPRRSKIVERDECTVRA